MPLLTIQVIVCPIEWVEGAKHYSGKFETSYVALSDVRGQKESFSKG